MVKQLFILILIGISICLSGGTYGLGPFLHAEAVLLVFGGTFLLTWAAYPLKEILHPSGPAPLVYAGGSAIGLGVLVTLLDLMVEFWVGPGTAELTRRFAAALAGLFYGFLLSKVIIAPIAARLAVRE
ncbi:MAG: hypothetical protein A2218_02330 [Elusimicrobia bacterium RIFOXYA2_FULL_53_38]|nr:MAG: hypothetical protein A2218_02330 [Elusimicrobia bacterium RIFOXYA2_FULL_53_38]